MPKPGARMMLYSKHSEKMLRYVRSLVRSALAGAGAKNIEPHQVVTDALEGLIAVAQWEGVKTSHQWCRDCRYGSHVICRGYADIGGACLCPCIRLTQGFNSLTKDAGGLRDDAVMQVAAAGVVFSELM